MNITDQTLGIPGALPKRRRRGKRAEMAKLNYTTHGGDQTSNIWISRSNDCLNGSDTSLSRGVRCLLKGTLCVVLLLDNAIHFPAELQHTATHTRGGCLHKGTLHTHDMQLMSMH